jgi:hypothetical protein
MAFLKNVIDPRKVNNQYHILNGDALKEQFPEQVEREVIVARECLVDGDVSGDSLEELFENRAHFIAANYEGASIEEYYAISASEFKKVQTIPHQSEINLWFEDDLFCQVNFWFTVSLIVNHSSNCHVFLIRPTVHTPYGFGGLNTSELIAAYEQRTPLTKLDVIASLWKSYQINDVQQLLETAKELEPKFPFVYNAVMAHAERIPTKGNLGRPVQSLVKIMAELQTDSFGPVFIEFNKRESIYGLGDLQVKRLYDEIKNKH